MNSTLSTTKLTKITKVTKVTKQLFLNSLFVSFASFVSFVVMKQLLVMPAVAAQQQIDGQVAVAECARAQPQITRIIDAANMRLEAARQSNSAPAMRAAMDDLQGALGQLRAQLGPCGELEKAAAADPHAGHVMPATPQPPAAPGAMPMMKPGSATPAPAAADPHAGHTMPAPAPAGAAKPAAPMDHSKMPMGGAPAAKPAAATGAKPAAPMDHSKMPMGAPGKDAQGKVMDPVTGLMVDPATAPKTTYQGQTYYFSSEQAREEFLQNPAKFARKPKS